MICWVTCWRISVWLGIVFSPLDTMLLYNLTDLLEPRLTFKIPIGDQGLRLGENGGNLGRKSHLRPVSGLKSHATLSARRETERFEEASRRLDVPIRCDRMPCWSAAKSARDSGQCGCRRPDRQHQRP